MSEQETSVPQAGAFVPLATTFGITLVNMAAITAGAVCAAQPALRHASLWIAAAATTVLALSALNWMVLRRCSLTAPPGQVIKTSAGILLPMLITSPAFPGAGGLRAESFVAIFLLLSVFVATLPPVSAALAYFVQRSVGTNRVAVYRPIEPAELPREVLDFFSQRTVELERMGFRNQGDYLVKEGRQQFSRLFTYGDGTVAAAVEVTPIGLFTKLKSTSFVTVLDNGCYIETSNVSIPQRTPKPHDVLILQSVTRGTDAERLEKHATMVREAAQIRFSPPRNVDPADLPALCRYGMKLLYDRLVQEGQLASSPYDNRDEAVFRAAPVAELQLA